MQDYHKLKVWEKAHLLAIDVYRLSEGFPRRDGVALTTQLRRAALSIPTNIAEGVGQSTAAECARFLSYAIASAFEVESHLVLAEKLDLKLPGIGDAIDETSQVRRMTHGLRQYYVEKAKREKAQRRDS